MSSRDLRPFIYYRVDIKAEGGVQALGALEQDGAAWTSLKSARSLTELLRVVLTREEPAAHILSSPLAVPRLLQRGARHLSAFASTI